MYESFYGLKRRPFAAMPDADCFIPINAHCEALSQLTRCVADGRGIGVLTAPAGLGKTLLCQRLARELEKRFTVVFLPSGHFVTRRSLLQSLLFELGQSHFRMGDQELWLAFVSYLRRTPAGQRGIVLIVDEAHLLAARMLEELRTFTVFAERAEPLVRLIVSGQPVLEETLAQPALDAFNQRIGSQTALGPLTRQESAEYVTRRLAWAGANVSDLFTSEALTAISEISDGSLRCVNQLCDHSLLLAYLQTERPVSIGAVRQALDDLKQLPLSWNEAVSSRPISSSKEWGDKHRGGPIVDRVEPPAAAEIASRDERVDARDIRLDLEPTVEAAVVEFGGPADDGDFAESDDFKHSQFFEYGQFGEATLIAAAPAAPPIASITVSAPADALPNPNGSANSTLAAATAVADEEVVIDRYAELDAAIGRLAKTMLAARAISRQREAKSAVNAQNRLAADEKPSRSSAFDVVMPEDAPTEIRSRNRSWTPPTQPSGKRPQNENRPYEFLFSELRRRRKGA